MHAKMGTVYANLFIDGDNKGPHAFLVPIRDDSGSVLPGIKISDCGTKMGLNGVDNGSIMFDHVRVPRWNILDRFGQVAEDGTYTTPIANSGVRFNTAIDTLVGGRIAVGCMANSVARYSLCLTILYALKRRQFGLPNKGTLSTPP
jgi:acyl-CoA oxidase